MSIGTVVEWVHEAEMDYKSALDLAKRRKDPIPKRVRWDCQQGAICNQGSQARARVCARKAGVG